jgi:hypothetical protein
MPKRKIIEEAMRIRKPGFVAINDSSFAILPPKTDLQRRMKIHSP